MATKTTTYLKDTNKDFNNVLDSMHNKSNVQRIVATGAFTIANDTTLVSLALDGAKTTTLPAAKVGRNIRMVWEVEQATADLVVTCAGSDTFSGNLSTKIEGDVVGDGDQIAVAATIVAITFVDDVNIGSYVDLQCASDGKWLVTGHLVLDAVGSIPTLA